MENNPFHTISEALEDIRNGKVVIVVDDESRENEGDFIAAADLITPEIINFMTIHGRGLICTPLPEERCEELGLDLMVGKTNDPNETAFTVSIDLLGKGVTTGISATDRFATIQALMQKETQPSDFAKPGHIFPLRAKEGGVLKRAGHTEAAVDLAKLAGLNPGGVIVEIMNEDGSMARVPDLLKLAEKHDIKIITIEDLIEYRLQYDSLIQVIDETPIKTKFGDFNLKTFQEKGTEQLHFALTKGEWTLEEEILVRVQSSNTYFDLFTSLAYGENPLLEKVSKKINEEGKGAIIFINNVTDSDLILKKLTQFKSFIEGEATKANLAMDTKDIGIGAQIIKELNIKNIKLLSRNPNPNFSLIGYNLDITESVEI